MLFTVQKSGQITHRPSSQVFRTESWSEVRYACSRNGFGWPWHTLIFNNKRSSCRICCGRECRKYFLRTFQYRPDLLVLVISCFSPCTTLMRVCWLLQHSNSDLRYANHRIWTACPQPRLKHCNGPLQRQCTSTEIFLSQVRCPHLGIAGEQAGRRWSR